MGVHTNMCVSGRPFALRQMARNGKRVVLARDLTDSMYNSRRPPLAAHGRGTELVIEHIEKYICPTILSADITGEAPRPRAVFVIGEDEYDTKSTLPAFAKAELEPRGVQCVFVHEAAGNPGDFQGIDALNDADLLFLSVRRRTPTTAQLAAIRRHIESGKPVIGIRTASHSFDSEPTDGREAWHDFDTAVLGGHYLGHYGTQPPEGGPSVIQVLADAAKNPILSGLPRDEIRLTSHLYKYRDLAKGTTVLMEGHVDGRGEREPVAWTNAHRGGRVFYTSIGNPADLQSPAIRKLLVNAVFWAIERQAPAP
jgi:type 1 glutamine amidotransferase